MKTKEVAFNLVFLPQMVNKLGNVSVCDLLKKIGYFELAEKISENDIHEELVGHLECINDWMMYSENKRSSAGWYIKQKSENEYVVGFYPNKEGKLIQIRYPDRISACAAFIKKEAEEIRLLSTYPCKIRIRSKLL